MDTLLKYCLSLLGIAVLFSCQGKSDAEKKAEADSIINSGHFLFSPSQQGSPKMMSLVEYTLDLDPQNADAWRELSIPYLKRGMPVQWKPYFDKAVTLHPDAWQGWRGYLYLYFYRNYKKAIADFDATDTITPNFDDSPQGQSVNYMRGVAYLGLKDLDNAIRYFDTYIEDQKNGSGEAYAEVTAFLYRGIAQYLKKEYSLAEQDFQKVLTYSGNHYADADYYLAKCFYDQQQLDKATLHIKKAIKDFETGYAHRRGYVEVLYQIYTQDLQSLQKDIENN